MFKRTKKMIGKTTEKVQTSVSRGLGLSILVDAGKFMNTTFRSFLNVSDIQQKESFAQAVRRLHLTEKDLANRRSRFFSQFLVFLATSFAALGYAIYLFMDGAWGSGIVAILMTALLMVYALRAHFWMFQIKNHKLGCTLSEWWNNKIVDENHPW